MVLMVPSGGLGMIEGEVIRRYSVEDKERERERERERDSKRNENQRIRIIAIVMC